MTGLDTKLVLAEGQEFPFTHPFDIHAKFYRTIEPEVDPDGRFRHFKAMKDYALPHHIPTWNYWSERRFREFCAGWKYMSWAGGASIGKSYDAAEIILLDWLSYPKGNTGIVASTTLKGLERRVWGYILRFITSMHVSFPYHYTRTSPPQLLYNQNDLIHGLFATAAKKGSDETAISDLIGRHPTHKLTVVLDEGTDMPVAIEGAFANLEKGKEGNFQCIIIGNSNSKHDLHGIMSTPLNGWDSVDPMKDIQWRTTRDKGTCLLFNCYESPAIFETDPEKKKILSKIFPTRAQIENDERILGKNSLRFYRFSMGFWRDDSAEPTILSMKFIKNFNTVNKTEWSPFRKLIALAGLDPAFSYGGDNCILRLALFGVDMNGQVILDYKKEELLFYIKTLANSDRSIELQIVDQVLAILSEYKIPLRDLAIDCSGQGRALAEVFRLRLNSIEYPIKLYSIQSYAIGRIKKIASDHDVKLISNYELWSDIRRFVETDNLRGLDTVSIHQFTSRLTEEENGKMLLEKKADYKRRMGAINPSLAVSPDEADGASIVLQVAMRNYGFFPGQVFQHKIADAYQGGPLEMGRPSDINVPTPAPQPHLHFGRGFSADRRNNMTAAGSLIGAYAMPIKKSPFSYK